MAVVFVEGFDTYNGISATLTAPGLATRWSNSTGAMVTGRFGGQAWRNPNSSATIGATLPATYNSGCVGFALYPISGSISTSFGIFGPRSGLSGGGTIANTGPQFTLAMNASYQLTIARYTTLLATATTPLVANTWSYVEIEFVISDTVGEIRVYVNNNPTPVISLSGIDTQYQTTSGFDSICLSTSGESYIDDLYVTDTPNRLGEQRIITSYPNSDVLTTYWSSSTGGAAPYTMIDEAQCDGDTTYVSSNTVNSRIVTGVPSLSVPPVSVNAVQITGFARKDETQLRQLALEYENTAGSVATGPTYTLGTYYTYMNDFMPQNPLTGSAWTSTDVNNMRIGARVVA